jgi:diguanylate cyclase (GGDEF)-like protein
VAVSSAPALVPEPEPDDGGVGSYRRLAEIFHDVLSELSLDSLLDRIADTLAELVPYDALHIYEADEQERELVPVLARSEWVEEILQTRPAYGQGITGWAVANRSPVLSNDAHLDPRVVFVPGTPPEPESLISVPLVARGLLKGALNIYRVGEGARFDEQEFELAQRFGDAAALALDNAQVRARLELQAQSDSLTGLYNHRYFHERLRAELTRASRARDSVSLLMFDIDEFKRVNDICGHAVGDQILIALAEMTLGLVRSSDIVCRLGGEEFAIIMPSCDAGDALGLSRRLMERLEKRPIDAAGEVTLSVGIAQGPQHAMNARELVACAEMAMMTAKSRGKNRIVVFNEETAERPVAAEPDRDVRSIAHLKMLQSLAGRLTRLNDVREIGESIVSELRMLIDYHTCRVYVVEGDHCAPVAYWGETGTTDGRPIAPPRLPLGQGVTGHVAETGRSMLIANALECEQYVQIPGTDPIDESIIAVPLRYGSRVSGVVFVSKLGLDQFDEDELRLLEVLAGHASVALENARLYEAVRQEAENAKSWLEFADALSGAASVEAIADETVATVALLLEVDKCSFWLEDLAACDFRCVSSLGLDGNENDRQLVRTRASRAAYESLVSGRKSAFLLDEDGMKRNFYREAVGLKLGAVAIAPLHPGYGVRGWIGARCPGGDMSYFTDERLRLLEGLAYRASVAMEKALLYRNHQEAAEVANALLECGRELASASGQEEMVERLVELTARMLEAPRAYAFFEDAEAGEIRLGAAYGVDPSPMLSFPVAEVGALLADRPTIVQPEDVSHIPGAESASVPLAVARVTLSGGRIGCIVAAAPSPEHEFPERKLRLLAGIADQATLALVSTETTPKASTAET